MRKLRIIFMGTPDLAAVILRELVGSIQHEIVAVITQADKPKGRELKPQASPVKQLAQSAGLLVIQPERARNPEFIEKVRALNPDLIVVAAYGQILPQTVLDLPPLGCINVHTSLLPKYRGAAPIQWAILNDDSETGITIMKMDAGLDTGPILSQARCPITEADNADSLHSRLAHLGANLLLKTIPEYASGKIKPAPQPEQGATYAPKIKKEDGRVNWQLPARAVWNRVRALTPWPGTFTFLPSARKSMLVKIWQASIGDSSGPPGEILRVDKSGIIVGCQSGSLNLLALQREGGRRLQAADFVAGFPLNPGQRFE